MHHYLSCGLEGIYLKNGYTEEDGPHGKGVSIYDVDGLHKAIAKGIVAKESALTGSEFRFLRHELDLSQLALGNLMDFADQSIANWEKGKVPIPRLADKAIRDLYLESINESQSAGLLNRLSQLDREYHEINLELERLESERAWRLSTAA